LLLLAGCGVFFVGGTLALYSPPPVLAHWTPAFPIFYAALAVPVAAWTDADFGFRNRRGPGPKSKIRNPKWRSVVPGVLALGLAALAWLNISFYFQQYYADPAIVKDPAYRAAQERLELRTAQARYQAALGPNYIVRAVGRTEEPCNPDTPYLVASQDCGAIPDPEAGLPLRDTGGKGLAFLFFPGNESYLPVVQSLYPGGAVGEVRSKGGRLLFRTYVVAPVTH